MKFKSINNRINFKNFKVYWKEEFNIKEEYELDIGMFKVILR